jgi:putative pyruvate formate lyase activating enzyme
MYPSYIDSYRSGQLERTVDSAFKMLESCSICPRKCGVNRLKDEKGFCRTGLKPAVYSFMAHHGEEPPISGKRGSGTIFFSNCNMNCAYCQNYEFSQQGRGREVDFEELSSMMLRLEETGCHNINLVTPTHIMPQILKSLQSAISGGLKIPIVYNTGGYELPQVIKILGGIVDIYLADMRYAQEEPAVKYSSAPDYPKYNRESLKEMRRQAGVVETDSNGIIKKGLVIRHLVLPNDVCGTEETMKFIKEELSQDTYISLMSQYLPYYNASAFKDICRRITKQEYQKAKGILQKYGLHNGWIQDSYGMERFAGVYIKSK